MTDVLRITIALFLWLAAFSGVYGLHGIACAYDWPAAPIGEASLFRLALVGAWGVALLAQLGLLLALRTARFGAASPFVSYVSVALAVAALVAGIWSLFPTAGLSACL